MSPRRLSGWEPGEFTRYEYERREAPELNLRWGWLRAVHAWLWRAVNPYRLLGSVTEREPEWSRSDVESLIAFMQTKRVGSHGFPMDVATSPLGDPSNPEREWEWHVPLPSVDYPSQELAKARKKYSDAYPDADMSALLWRVEKRPIRGET